MQRVRVDEAPLARLPSARSRAAPSLPGVHERKGGAGRAAPSRGAAAAEPQSDVDAATAMQVCFPRSHVSANGVGGAAFACTPNGQTSAASTPAPPMQRVPVDEAGARGASRSVF
jgi:hypothetical protein